MALSPDRVVARCCAVKSCRVVPRYTCHGCPHTYCSTHFGSKKAHPCKAVPPNDFSNAFDYRRLADRIMLVSYLYATPMRSRLDEIRPGVGYRFEAPTADMLIKGYEANKALEGGLNIHIPITFDDGVKWLVRARKLNPEVDKTFQQLGLANELHTISLLRAIAPEFIPNAWASTQHPSLYHIPHMFVECAAGKSYKSYFEFIHEHDPVAYFHLLEHPHDAVVGDKAVQPFLVTVRDFAQFMIKILSIKFRGVGSLWPNVYSTAPIGRRNPGHVGKLVSLAYSEVTGPYVTSRDFYLEVINERIDSVLKGHDRQYGKNYREGEWDDFYFLALLEVHRLVSECDEMRLASGPTYLRHGDEKFDIMFLRPDGHLAAIIDWEFAYTAHLPEAIAWEVFINFDDFQLGKNALHPMELALIEEYERLGRSDLAEAFKGCRKYQRLRYLLHNPFCYWSTAAEMWALRDAFQPGSAGSEPPETNEKWLWEATDRYFLDPRWLHYMTVWPTHGDGRRFDTSRTWSELAMPSSYAVPLSSNGDGEEDADLDHARTQRASWDAQVAEAEANPFTLTVPTVAPVSPPPAQPEATTSGMPSGIPVPTRPIRPLKAVARDPKAKGPVAAVGLAAVPLLTPAASRRPLVAGAGTNPLADITAHAVNSSVTQQTNPAKPAFIPGTVPHVGASGVRRQPEPSPPPAHASPGQNSSDEDASTSSSFSDGQLAINLARERAERAVAQASRHRDEPPRTLSLGSEFDINKHVLGLGSLGDSPLLNVNRRGGARPDRTPYPGYATFDSPEAAHDDVDVDVDEAPTTPTRVNGLGLDLGTPRQSPWKGANILVPPAGTGTATATATRGQRNLSTCVYAPTTAQYDPLEGHGEPSSFNPGIDSARITELADDAVGDATAGVFTAQVAVHAPVRYLPLPADEANGEANAGVWWNARGDNLPRSLPSEVSLEVAERDAGPLSLLPATPTPTSSALEAPASILKTNGMVPTATRVDETKARRRSWPDVFQPPAPASTVRPTVKATPKDKKPPRRSFMDRLKAPFRSKNIHEVRVEVQGFSARTQARTWTQAPVVPMPKCDVELEVGAESQGQAHPKVDVGLESLESQPEPETTTGDRKNVTTVMLRLFFFLTIFVEVKR